MYELFTKWQYDGFKYMYKLFKNANMLVLNVFLNVPQNANMMIINRTYFSQSDNTTVLNICIHFSESDIKMFIKTRGPWWSYIAHLIKQICILTVEDSVKFTALRFMYKFYSPAPTPPHPPPPHSLPTHKAMFFSF